MNADEDQIRLRHMRDAAQQALGFIQGETRASLDHDVKLVLALVKAIEIVGEAASRVSDDFQRAHREIPWPQIVGMRNRLIHAYFDVNLDILWQTASERLQPLIQQLEAFIIEPDDQL